MEYNVELRILSSKHLAFMSKLQLFSIMMVLNCLTKKPLKSKEYISSDQK